MKTKQTQLNSTVKDRAITENIKNQTTRNPTPKINIDMYHINNTKNDITLITYTHNNTNRENLHNILFAIPVKLNHHNTQSKMLLYVTDKYKGLHN